MGLSEKLNITGCRLIGGIPLDIISFGAGFFAGLYQNTGRGLAASFFPAAIPIFGARGMVEDRYEGLINEKATLERYGKLDQELSQRIDREIERLGSDYNKQTFNDGFRSAAISTLETAAGYGLGYAISTLAGQ